MRRSVLLIGAGRPFVWAMMMISTFLMLMVFSSTSALPAGFEDENVVAINGVVDMAFADNMLLAVTKTGTVYTFDLADPNADRQMAADLEDRVCTNGERG